MDAGKIIYIIFMGFTLATFGGITYLFKKVKDYSLLSGFSNRPEEEQEYLKKSGYLTAIGNVFYISFIILLITFIGGLFPIPWAFEIGMGAFILYLMGGFVWVQRYEVPHKRKKMFWIYGVISGGTIIFIIIILSLGFINNNDMYVHEETFEITGMYGDEWSLEEIEKVELIDELPEIKMKTDGFAMTNILKGKFKLEEPYGNSLLFIHGENKPYLAILTEENSIFINRKDSEETIDIYEKLIKEMQQQ